MRAAAHGMRRRGRSLAGLATVVAAVLGLGLGMSCMQLSAVSRVAAADQDLRLYPDSGGLNLRVPVAPTVPGGARGKCLPLERVTFGYALAPHLQLAGEGSCTFWVRDSERRESKEVLRLENATGAALSLTIADATAGRSPALRFSVPGVGKAKATETSVSMPARIFGGDWTQVILAWDGAAATLQIGDTLADPLALPAGFRPTRLELLGWAVDELTLRGADGASLALDWERDYSAVLTPPTADIANTDSALPLGGVTAQVMGMDSVAVSTDIARRDCPVVYLLNSSDSPRQVSLDFTLSREVNPLDTRWQKVVDLPPRSSQLYPIALPQPLLTDVYHLQVVGTGLDTPLDARHHFMYVERRQEAPGTVRFGLHDCDVRVFGFWPDALPMTVAHKYLRWGYTVGPPWARNSDGTMGIPADLPVAEWNWPVELDWEIASGRDMFVCIQSTPFADWQREREYEGHMKEYPWGKVGGFPNLDAYATFVRESALRYQHTVRRWEIENEPSSHLREYPEDYAAIARTVSKALRPVIPEATIYGISGTSTFVPWMRKVFAAGGATDASGKDGFDAVSWHTYTTPRQPDVAGLAEMLAEGQRVVPPGMEVFNSETGILVAPRDVIDQPIPPETVAARIRERDPVYVTAAAWPGAVNDEWQASASIIKNAVINFQAGATGYVFFGWNPAWPKDLTNATRPTFAVIGAAPDGQRSPTRLTLAIGVLSAQLEGLDVATPGTAVSQGEALGSVFAKTGGGQVACLWSKVGNATLLLAAPAAQLECVDAFGSPSVLNPVGLAPAAPGATGKAAPRYLYCLELGAMPQYIHASTGGLEVQPSPIAQVTNSTDADGAGSVSITIANPTDAPQTATVRPAADARIALSPPVQTVTVAPRSSQTVDFTYALPTTTKARQQSLSFIADLPIGRFQFATQVSLKPTIPIQPVPADLAAPSLSALQQAGCLPLPLNDLEQVVVGRPSKLASLQEPQYWGGPDELSATAYLGYNEKYLFAAVEVRDPQARPPVKWPGVGGACIEFFADLRTPATGLQATRYTKEVYQLVLPAPLADGTPTLLWCPSADDAAAPAVLHAGAVTETGYWLAIAIPWSAGDPEAAAAAITGRVLGFDIGVNGGWPDKPGRKSQIMLFGTAYNSQSAANFGRLLCAPATTPKGE